MVMQQHFNPREARTLVVLAVPVLSLIHISMQEEFPQTANGKVQKYKLRELAAQLFPEAAQGGRKSRRELP